MKKYYTLGPDCADEKAELHLCCSQAEYETLEMIHSCAAYTKNINI